MRRAAVRRFLLLPLISALTVLPANSPYAADPDSIAKKDGVEWISIPGGTFMMGSSKPEGQGPLVDESPAHALTIKAFRLAKSPVTNKQYRVCVAAGACAAIDYEDCVHRAELCPASEKCGARFSGDDQPAACVSWSDAKTFSAWVGGRLPSEAEWEYAARSAGKDWQYPWGNEAPTCERAVLFEKGWLAVNVESNDDWGCGRKATWPVCSKPKGNTKQGLCDMAGNVRQWVEDIYASYAHARTDGSPQTIADPPENPEDDNRPMHVLRGGSWNDSWFLLRSRVRHFGCSDCPWVQYGFRPAK